MCNSLVIFTASSAGFEFLVCLSCSSVELLCLDLGLGLGLVRFGQENARKSGFVFFSVFVEDELVLNSCRFWILIMFFLFYFVKVDTLKKIR